MRPNTKAALFRSRIYLAITALVIAAGGSLFAYAAHIAPHAGFFIRAELLAIAALSYVVSIMIGVIAIKY